MPRTIAEVQKDLNTVNAALQEMIAGRRITEFRIGSGSLARLYKFQEITLETLQGIRAGLLQELALLDNSDNLVFRKNCNIPLVTTKFRYRG